MDNNEQSDPEDLPRSNKGAGRVALLAMGLFAILAVTAGLMGYERIAGAMAMGMLLSFLLAPWARR